MNDKNKQTPRAEPQAAKPKGYGPRNEADLDQYGYFRIGLDDDRMAGTKPADRTRPLRNRARARDDGYER